MDVNDRALDALARQIGEHLAEKKQCLATAESCTGGWVAKVITDVPGSSHWFDRGFVTYTNQSKQDMLAVTAEVLQHHGAVSEATVLAMVRGALEKSKAHYSLAISGIAGPGGGSDDKPVGLVWFAWASYEVEKNQIHTMAEHKIFNGDRESVRRQAVAHALQGLLKQI